MAQAAVTAAAVVAAAAVAAANVDVDTCLVPCGLGANARRFAAVNGINTVECFGTSFEVTQTPDMIKIHNDTYRVLAQKLGVGHAKKLKALIHWVKDKQRRQLPVVAAEWTNAELHITLEGVRNFAIINKATPVTDDVGEIDIGLRWFK